MEKSEREQHSRDGKFYCFVVTKDGNTKDERAKWADKQDRKLLAFTLHATLEFSFQCEK